MKKLDRFRGCLLAGAAGDALGYAVEFIPLNTIRTRYGPGGIRAYDLREGLALISDDTQMTLFTANGLLLGEQTGDYAGSIHRCYLDWLLTQRARGEVTEGKVSWLNGVPALNHPRAPGNTCLAALESGKAGSVRQPINNSKGCGGVMRVAPAGLYFEDPARAASIAAEAAALTHGHPLGWLPAALLGAAVSLAAYTDLPLDEVIRESEAVLQRLWPELPELSQLLELTERAVSLAENGLPDIDAIRQLGQGWVGDEALAIAVFCALRYPEDLEGALIASVNHSGDSDSTGSIAGNLLGARLGLSALPAAFREHLEASDTILQAADDLFAGPAGLSAQRKALSKQKI
ncbi:MAG: ADP-ribosylglycohydrolase family protein [Oscillospiraceae bacterium]|nr:ADP-ribosylglycohydrolase family protein [Oscillospiraceae bacterium]